MTPPNASDVRRILGDAQLAQLRAQFKNEDMVTMARGASVDVYPPTSAFPTLLLDYYDSAGGGSMAGAAEPMTPGERELVLLGVTSSKIEGRGMNLSIHVYWGLMVGLSVQRVADVLALSGVYNGMQVYTCAFSVLKHSLETLASATVEGADLSAFAIIPLLAQRFA